MSLDYITIVYKVKAMIYIYIKICCVLQNSKNLIISRILKIYKVITNTEYNNLKLVWYLCDDFSETSSKQIYKLSDKHHANFIYFGFITIQNASNAIKNLKSKFTRLPLLPILQFNGELKRFTIEKKSYLNIITKMHILRKFYTLWLIYMKLHVSEVDKFVIRKIRWIETNF